MADEAKKPEEPISGVLGTQAPLTPDQTKELIGQLKIKVFDIMGKQADLSSQWTNLENEKTAHLKRLSELEKVKPAA